MDKLERDEKKMILDDHISYLQQLLLAKSGVLPVISSVSAAILVIATFNNLVPINAHLKICIAILLIIIPISLLFYLIEMSLAIKNTKDGIEKVVGKLPLRKENWSEKIKNVIFYTMPFILATIISVIILYFVYLLLSHI